MRVVFARANRLSPNRKLQPRPSKIRAQCHYAAPRNRARITCAQKTGLLLTERDRDRSGIRVSKIAAGWTHGFFCRCDYNIFDRFPPEHFCTIGKFIFSC